MIADTLGSNMHSLPPNNASLSDAYLALRASSGAAKRER